MGVMALTPPTSLRTHRPITSPVSLDTPIEAQPAQRPQGDVSQHSLLRRGAIGQEVEQLQARLREAGFDPGNSGQFDERTEQAVRAYQTARGLQVDGIVGQQTWGSFYGQNLPPGRNMLRGGQPTGYPTDDTFEPSNVTRTGGSTPTDPAARTNAVTPAANVDQNHPWMRALANERLSNGPDRSCVRTTLNNMARLGIPNTPGSTGADPNNARGAMVQLLRNGQWTSLNLPGSQTRTIRSPYGTVQAQVVSADDYRRMANAGQIPSGSVIFQTRHGWNYSGGPYGNDMGIVRNGGRNTHNYRTMPGVIYRDAREVVILVPSAAAR